jgi:hypothetical protein
MIVARDLTGTLTSLVKKIDAATAKNRDADMRSFVVFLNDDEGFEKKVKEFAKKENIKHTILSVLSDPKGPRGYHIAKDADVTVLLYVHKTVKANFAFPKGELRPRNVDKIVGDLGKILPKD